MTLAVSTGIDSFLNPQDIGAMYPFVGAEVAFFAVALFLWLGWHFLQARGETRENRDAVAMYETVGLDHAMRHEFTPPGTGGAEATTRPATTGRTDGGTSPTGGGPSR